MTVSVLGNLHVVNADVAKVLNVLALNFLRVHVVQEFLGLTLGSSLSVHVFIGPDLPRVVFNVLVSWRNVVNLQSLDLVRLGV